MYQQKIYVIDYYKDLNHTHGQVSLCNILNYLAASRLALVAATISARLIARP